MTGFGEVLIFFFSGRFSFSMNIFCFFCLFGLSIFFFRCYKAVVSDQWLLSVGGENCTCTQNVPAKWLASVISWFGWIVCLFFFIFNCFSLVFVCLISAKQFIHFILKKKYLWIYRTSLFCRMNIVVVY